MSPRLPKGSEVRCIRKHHLIARTNTDLQIGMKIALRDFDFEPGQERIAGEPTTCKICGSEYMLEGTIFDGREFWPFVPKLAW